MTTTPETPEQIAQIIADAMDDSWQDDAEYAHAPGEIYRRLRDASLLVGAPTEEQPREERCPECFSLGGAHGRIHVRHPQGGGGWNRPCSRAAGVAPQEPSEVHEFGQAGDYPGHSEARCKKCRDSAPSPDREKLITEAQKAVWAEIHNQDQRRMYSVAEVKRLVYSLDNAIADTLAAAPVLDEAKVAEVINRALDEWEGEESSEVFVARAICEADSEGRLRGGGR